MSGYQEVLTDPSYLGQIVTMTSPHQGNYGVNEDDAESDGVRVAGFAVRAASRRASSWRATSRLDEYLAAAGTVAIEWIDTRRLTLRIRDRGAMRAAISTIDLDPSSLVERILTSREMEGADLAATASTVQPYEAASIVGPAGSRGGRVFRVAAYDFGLKRNILRRLAEHGCEATVLPARTPARDVLAGDYDGVFLSNGPGDPAATTYGINAVRGLLGRIPMFGICLGHQLLALALGGSTYKLKFGHRGTNHPVKNLDTGHIEITSQNHGFTVDQNGWNLGAPGRRGRRAAAGGPPAIERSERGGGGGVNSRPVPLVDTPFGGVALTHWNINDGTLEGLRCLDVPAFSVQYHPEAAPGPHDSSHLFGRFRELMSRA